MIVKHDGEIKPANIPILCVQGALVGAGAILPGISGGVLLVAFGIYEPMMAILANPIKSFSRYYKMFIPFLIGWVAGFILLAGAVEMLFNASSALAMMLFAGLICGTMPALISESELSGSGKSWTPYVISLAAAFFVLKILDGQGVETISPNALWYLFCGVVWGLSLVIPGLSSSSILIFLGLYQPMTAGIAQLDACVIAPLGAGILITIISTARFINGIFSRNYSLISRVVLGVITAATIMIFPADISGARDIFLAAACFGVGFCLARWMDLRKGGGESVAVSHQTAGGG
ncbi:MAG: DUF368 domain-containing protein [Clostridia bacterium]|nr:DUF368 domain-containing protein [Clostridia bacterium]